MHANDRYACRSRGLVFLLILSVGGCELMGFDSLEEDSTRPAVLSDALRERCRIDAAVVAVREMQRREAMSNQVTIPDTLKTPIFEALGRRHTVFAAQLRERTGQH